MSFFGLLFWIAVLWLVIRWWRRSQCAAVGAGSYGPWEHGQGRYQARGHERTYTDTRQDYIESLESRVSELEERLDFTERLLASRREPSSAA
jgi:hypothetical protein